MHALYLVLLTLNLLVETLAGTALIAGPDGIAAAGRGGLWSMHYGFAALAVASISVWGFVYRALPQVRHAVQGILLLFHAGIALSLTLAGDQAVGGQGGEGGAHDEGLVGVSLGRFWADRTA